MLIDRTEYYTCRCYDTTCVMGVSITSFEKGDKYMSFFLQLSPYLPWYKRVYHGFRYILRLTPKKYHWGEILIRDEDLARLKSQIEEYENAK